MKCNITLNEKQKESSLGYELYPTPERIVPEIIDTDINKTQLLQIIQAGIILNGFRGGFIVTNEELDAEVPESFPNRIFVDENEVQTIKTFREYGTVISSGETNFIVLGERDASGNRVNDVSSEEFYLWVNHFGTDNILTAEEAIALRDQLEPNNDL